MMQLNIQELANQKIQEMHNSGQVKKHLDEAIEKTVLRAIDEAVNGYELRRALEKAVAEGVSTVAAEVSFTAYNGFIAEKVKQMMEGVLLEDVADKLQQHFDSMFINKVERIKLSEILDKYREWICEEVDEQEKYDLQHFCADIVRGPHGWLTFTMTKEPLENRNGYMHRKSDDGYFSFVISRNNEDKKTGRMYGVNIEGTDLFNAIVFRTFSKFQIFIMNLLYCKTLIDIDVEHEDDIDTSYDVDC